MSESWHDIKKRIGLGSPTEEDLLRSAIIQATGASQRNGDFWTGDSDTFYMRFVSVQSLTSKQLIDFNLVRQKLYDARNVMYERVDDIVDEINRIEEAYKEWQSK